MRCDKKMMQVYFYTVRLTGTDMVQRMGYAVHAVHIMCTDQSVQTSYAPLKFSALKSRRRNDVHDVHKMPYICKY